MNKTNITDLWVGWSTGYCCANMSNQKGIFKPQEISSFNVALQFNYLSELASTLNNFLPLYPFKHSVQVLCNITPLLSLAGIGLCSAIPKEKINFNQHVTSFFNCIAGHLGNVVRVAVIATAIGLIVLGHTASGGATLTAVAYHAIDHMGLVPRRISLFIEKHFSTISFAGMCLGGTMFARVISVIILSTSFMPSWSRPLHYKIDAFMRSRSEFEEPTLKEIDSPFVRQDEMTFDEINRVLNHHPAFYKANPAHCVRPIINLDEFFPDYRFEKYLLLFNEVEEETTYDLIKDQLKDNECFIDLLVKEFPRISRDTIRENIHDYLGQLTAKEGLSRNEYVIRWMQQQMAQFIEVLQGKKRVIGSQQQLEESIQICARLLPYLSSLENGSIEDKSKLRNVLLHLAIQGGSCHAQKIKTVLDKLVSTTIQDDQENREIRDPVKDFEMKVLRALQNQRFDLFKEISGEIKQNLRDPSELTLKILEDTFRLGLLPMTKAERNNFPFSHIFSWVVLHDDRAKFYARYRYSLHDTIKKIGFEEHHYANYFDAILKSNERLSDEQRESLLKTFSERNNGKWTQEQTLANFHRLLLVRMGILIPA